MSARAIKPGFCKDLEEYSSISPLILPFDQLCHICIKLGCCFSGMIKARASGSKVYLYFMKKGRQARHRIPRNSCYDLYGTTIIGIDGKKRYLTPQYVA